MSMVIGTNMASLTAQRHLASSQNELQTSMERLASGKRINSAMDDAAGLAISHKLDSKIAGLNQAHRNANDGISMLQTAEGALEEISSILTRMKELAVQSSNDTLTGTSTSDTNTDRAALQDEYTALKNEIDRITTNTTFNGIKVIGQASTKTFQLGDSASDKIDFSFKDMSSSQIGTTAGSSATTDVVSTATATHTPGTASSAQAVAFQLTDSDLTSTNKYLTVTVAGKTYTQERVESNVASAAAKDHMEATMMALAGQITADTGFSLVKVENASGKSTLTLTSGSNSATQIDVGNLSITKSTASTGTANIGAQDLRTKSGAQSASTVIDNAIQMVDDYRADLGATSNRLEHTISNLSNRIENQSATRSRIEDADFAAESANLAKAQVLQQAGTAMLAQANASTQNVLSLLK